MQDKPVLYVNGFFRSATTYTYSIIKLAFPQLNVKHGHSPLFIKKGIENNNPIVACIRNPIDSISSAILLMNQENGSDDSIKDIIKKNIDSLSAINKEVNSVVVSNFEDIIKDHKPILKKISDKYGYEHVVPEYDNIARFLPKMQGDELIRAGRLPRDSYRLKSISLSRLEDEKFKPLLDQSLSLYNSLL
jgi:hypothetical protein